MTRRTYTPNKLDSFKIKRNEYTIKQNRNIEPYKHVALVISRKGGGAIIGYGANTCNNEYGSRHAEDMAFENARRFVSKNKGQNLSNRRHRMKVDIVVLRTTGGNSRPCYHCITEQIMNNNHFNVRKVIYSDNDIDDGYVVTNKSALYEKRSEHFSGFHQKVSRDAENIINDLGTNNTNKCCDGHNHEHDECGDEDVNEEDETDKELRRFCIDTND